VGKVSWLETIGGALVLLASLGVVLLFLAVWLPWAWVYYVENAKWSQACGDLSRWTRWTLLVDQWLRQRCRGKP
jgi:hypothetical protein